MTPLRQTGLVPLSFGLLPTTLCLVSIDPAKNRYRYYRLSHQRTLWDEDVLVQSWGPLGTDGHSRLCFLDDAEQAQTMMAKLLGSAAPARLPGPWKPVPKPPQARRHGHRHEPRPHPYGRGAETCAQATSYWLA